MPAGRAFLAGLMVTNGWKAVWETHVSQINCRRGFAAARRSLRFPFGYGGVRRLE